MSAIAITGVSRPRRLRRRLALGIIGTLLVGGLGTAGVGAAVYHHQQDLLGSARGDRDAALLAFDAAVDRARADGVVADRLAGLVRRREALVAEPALLPRLRYFDGGEVGHLRAQADALHGLVDAIPAVEARALADERATATALVNDLELAIDTAEQLGLDESPGAVSLAAARTAVSEAPTPGAVATAVSGLAVVTQDIRKAVADKLVALAAEAAARQAALDAARANASSMLSRADSLLAQVRALPQLQVDDAPTVIAAEHAAFDAAKTLADYQAVTTATGPPVRALTAILQARSDAYAAMSLARLTVTVAQRDNIDPGNDTAQLDALQPQLDAAGTIPAFQDLGTRIAAVVAPLRAQIAKAEVGIGKVIYISLTDQALTAYQDGIPLLKTLVTTGRPALPTPTGDFAVVRKNSPWRMVSEYPPGSIGYYPPSWVQWVLWFTNDGYGIHDAPWRSTYGPGTEQYGSHGCVNVPAASMQQLYSWADVGTRVMIRTASAP